MRAKNLSQNAAASSKIVLHCPVVLIASKFLTLAISFLLSSSGYSQSQPAGATPRFNNSSDTNKLPAWPEIKLPTANSTADWYAFLQETKRLQPTTPDRYIQMQKAIREASKRILELDADRTSAKAKSIEFDYLSSSIMLMGNEGPESQKKTFERFRDYVKLKSNPDSNDFQMVLLAMQNLEQNGDGKVSAEAYRQFASIFKTKKNPEHDIWIGMLEANAKRVELPGKVMEVVGKTITGDDFDIVSQRGKFTLVYFLASWCKPCREEFPYMRDLYRRYKDQGFEIVAISVDEDKEKLEAFLRELEVPWITLWDQENKTEPAAVRTYGISAIPTMILLDREGKVVSMEARGLILGRLLEKQMAKRESQK